MKQLFKNKVVKVLLTFGLGVAVGAIFYPTQHIEERIKKESQEEINRISSEFAKKDEQQRETIDKLKEEKTTLRIETSHKVSKLQYQVRELQAKKKETFYKIIKPDGTIEEKRYSESEVNESSKVVLQVREEFDRKITEISERWQRVHTVRVRKLKEEFDKKESDYQKRISKLESEKIVDINPKKYGVELGYQDDKQWYAHPTMDLFGPVFLGGHASTDFEGEYTLGVGVGLRF